MPESTNPITIIGDRSAGYAPVTDVCMASQRRKPEPAVFDLATSRCGQPTAPSMPVEELAAHRAAAEQARRAVHLRSASQAGAEPAGLIGPAVAGSIR